MSALVRKRSSVDDDSNERQSLRRAAHQGGEGRETALFFLECREFAARMNALDAASSATIVAPLLMRGLRCFKKVHQRHQAIVQILEQRRIQGASERRFFNSCTELPLAPRRSALFAIFIAGDSGRELPFKFV